MREFYEELLEREKILESQAINLPGKKYSDETYFRLNEIRNIIVRVQQILLQTI